MGRAKDILVKPIRAADANRIVRALHYSGKVVNNSQVHLGVFLDGRCGGALQFGPSLDKRKLIGLVRGTLWNEFIELNRMALADWLPRNGESRAIAVALRLMRCTYPWLKWVVSFADAAQCGDGTIYRASGFVLTGIKVNNQLWAAPTGEVFTSHACRNVDHHTKEHAKAMQVFSRTSLTDGRSKQQQQQAKGIVSRASMIMKGKNGACAQRRDHEAAGLYRENGASSMAQYVAAGWRPIPGFQLRYVYFLDPTARERLTVPILPFSEIERRGAGMYRGKPRAGSEPATRPPHQAEEGGATPTPALSQDAPNE